MNYVPKQTITDPTPGSVSNKEFYQQARGICRDLFQVKPIFYWIDFTLSAIIAYTLASVFLAGSMLSPVTWLAFLGAAVLIYRASMFIHEIVHLPRNELKAFRRFWNFFGGVPMMVPSFTYESHTHHHSCRHYGTEDDGEYLPLASGTLLGLFAFLAQIIFQPLVVYFRYLVWTPVSFLHPALRRWTLQHASSLVINFKYQNESRVVKHTREDTFWEIFTSFRAMVMIGLVIFGFMPYIRLPKLLLLAMFVLAMNHVRTLVAHRYKNADGGAISHLDQFHDSINITGNWWTELLCPLGLRYHALHHLFPGIPYYNLGIAHRRLVEQLPPDSPYHETVYDNFSTVFRELLDSIAESPRETLSRPDNRQQEIKEATQ